MTAARGYVTMALLMSSQSAVERPSNRSRIVVVITVQSVTAGIVSKRLKMSSNSFLGLVALPMWFSNTALWLLNSNRKGACHSGGLRKFRPNNAEQ